jgi:hypothetical protein
VNHKGDDRQRGTKGLTEFWMLVRSAFRPSLTRANLSSKVRLILADRRSTRESTTSHVKRTVSSRSGRTLRMRMFTGSSAVLCATRTSSAKGRQPGLEKTGCRHSGKRGNQDNDILQHDVSKPVEKIQKVLPCQMAVIKATSAKERPDTILASYRASQPSTQGQI